MLYHFHFDEENAPCDEAFNHDIFIKSSKKLDVERILSDISKIKSRMDDGYSDIEDEYEDKDTYGKIYAKYSDYGWHEKIDEALNLVIAKHPEFDIEILKFKTTAFEIN